MRIYGDLFDAFEELLSCAYDIRHLLTRSQRRRLDDAIEGVRGLVKVLPEERPLSLPSEPEQPPADLNP